jgi:hypothetical protein
MELALEVRLPSLVSCRASRIGTSLMLDVDLGLASGGPEMISGVRASSIRIESTSSTIA